MDLTNYIESKLLESLWLTPRLWPMSIAKFETLFLIIHMSIVFALNLFIAFANSQKDLTS